MHDAPLVNSELHHNDSIAANSTSASVSTVSAAHPAELAANGSSTASLAQSSSSTASSASASTSSASSVSSSASSILSSTSSAAPSSSSSSPSSSSSSASSSPSSASSLSASPSSSSASTSVLPPAPLFGNASNGPNVVISAEHGNASISNISLQSASLGANASNITSNATHLASLLPSAAVNTSNITIVAEHGVNVTAQPNATSSTAASSHQVPTVSPAEHPQEKPHLNASQIFVAKGIYVKTSATEKVCKVNQDCYQLREPDEWCPLPDLAKYGDKGCFCDHNRNLCAIQRQVPGRGDEYSDCADKSTSACAGLKPIIRLQQQHNKNKKKRLRVH